MICGRSGVWQATKVYFCKLASWLVKTVQGRDPEWDRNKRHDLPPFTLHNLHPPGNRQQVPSSESKHQAARWLKEPSMSWDQVAGLSGLEKRTDRAHLVSNIKSFQYMSNNCFSHLAKASGVSLPDFVVPKTMAPRLFFPQASEILQDSVESCLACPRRWYHRDR